MKKAIKRVFALILCIIFSLNSIPIRTFLGSEAVTKPEMNQMSNIQSDASQSNNTDICDEDDEERKNYNILRKLMVDRQTWQKPAEAVDKTLEKGDTNNGVSLEESKQVSATLSRVAPQQVTASPNSDEVSDQGAISMSGNVSLTLPNKYIPYSDWAIFGEGVGSKITIKKGESKITDLELTLHNLTLSGGGNQYISIDVQEGMNVILLVDGTTSLTSGNAPTIKVAENSTLTIKPLNEGNESILLLNAIGDGEAIKSDGKVIIDGSVSVRAVSGGGLSLSNLTLGDKSHLESYCTGESALNIGNTLQSSINDFLYLKLAEAVPASEVFATAVRQNSCESLSIGESTIRLKSFAVWVPKKTYTVDLHNGESYICVQSEDGSTAQFGMSQGGRECKNSKAVTWITLSADPLELDSRDSSGVKTSALTASVSEIPEDSGWEVTPNSKYKWSLSQDSPLALENAETADLTNTASVSGDKTGSSVVTVKNTVRKTMGSVQKENIISASVDLTVRDYTYNLTEASVNLTPAVHNNKIVRIYQSDKLNSTENYITIAANTTVTINLEDININRVGFGIDIGANSNVTMNFLNDAKIYNVDNSDDENPKYGVTINSRGNVNLTVNAKEHTINTYGFSGAFGSFTLDGNLVVGQIDNPMNFGNSSVMTLKEGSSINAGGKNINIGRLVLEAGTKLQNIDRLSVVANNGNEILLSGSSISAKNMSTQSDKLRLMNGSSVAIAESLSVSDITLEDTNSSVAVDNLEVKDADFVLSDDKNITIRKSINVQNDHSLTVNKSIGLSLSGSIRAAQINLESSPISVGEITAYKGDLVIRNRVSLQSRAISVSGNMTVGNDAELQITNISGYAIDVNGGNGILNLPITSSLTAFGGESGAVRAKSPASGYLPLMINYSFPSLSVSGSSKLYVTANGESAVFPEGLSIPTYKPNENSTPVTYKSVVKTIEGGFDDKNLTVDIQNSNGVFYCSDEYNEVKFLIQTLGGDSSISTKILNLNELRRKMSATLDAVCGDDASVLTLDYDGIPKETGWTKSNTSWNSSEELYVVLEIIDNSKALAKATEGDNGGNSDVTESITFSKPGIGGITLSDTKTIRKRGTFFDLATTDANINENMVATVYQSTITSESIATTGYRIIIAPNVNATVRICGVNIVATNPISSSGGLIGEAQAAALDRGAAIEIGNNSTVNLIFTENELYGGNITLSSEDITDANGETHTINYKNYLRGTISPGIYVKSGANVTISDEDTENKSHAFQAVAYGMHAYTVSRGVYGGEGYSGIGWHGANGIPSNANIEIKSCTLSATGYSGASHNWGFENIGKRMGGYGIQGNITDCLVKAVGGNSGNLYSNSGIPGGTGILGDITNSIVVAQGGYGSGRGTGGTGIKGNIKGSIVKSSGGNREYWNSHNYGGTAIKGNVSESKIEAHGGNCTGGNIGDTGAYDNGENRSMGIQGNVTDSEVLAIGGYIKDKNSNLSPGVGINGVINSTKPIHAYGSTAITGTVGEEVLANFTQLKWDYTAQNGDKLYLSPNSDGTVKEVDLPVGITSYATNDPGFVGEFTADIKKVSDGTFLSLVENDRRDRAAQFNVDTLPPGETIAEPELTPATFPFVILNSENELGPTEILSNDTFIATTVLDSNWQIDGNTGLSMDDESPTGYLSFDESTGKVTYLNTEGKAASANLNSTATLKKKGISEGIEMKAVTHQIYAGDTFYIDEAPAKISTAFSGRTIKVMQKNKSIPTSNTITVDPNTSNLTLFLDSLNLSVPSNSEQASIWVGTGFTGEIVLNGETKISVSEGATDANTADRIMYLQSNCTITSDGSGKLTLDGGGIVHTGIEGSFTIKNSNISIKNIVNVPNIQHASGVVGNVVLNNSYMEIEGIVANNNTASGVQGAVNLTDSTIKIHNIGGPACHAAGVWGACSLVNSTMEIKDIITPNWNAWGIRDNDCSMNNSTLSIENISGGNSRTYGTSRTITASNNSKVSVKNVSAAEGKNIPAEAITYLNATNSTIDIDGINGNANDTKGIYRLTNCNNSKINIKSVKTTVGTSYGIQDNATITNNSRINVNAAKPFNGNLVLQSGAQVCAEGSEDKLVGGVLTVNTGCAFFGATTYAPEDKTTAATMVGSCNTTGVHVETSSMPGETDLVAMVPNSGESMQANLKGHGEGNAYQLFVVVMPTDSQNRGNYMYIAGSKSDDATSPGVGGVLMYQEEKDCIEGEESFPQKLSVAVNGNLEGAIPAAVDFSKYTNLFNVSKMTSTANITEELTNQTVFIIDTDSNNEDQQVSVPAGLQQAQIILSGVDISNENPIEIATNEGDNYHIICSGSNKISNTGENPAISVTGEGRITIENSGSLTVQSKSGPALSGHIEISKGVDMLAMSELGDNAIDSGVVTETPVFNHTFKDAKLSDKPTIEDTYTVKNVQNNKTYTMTLPVCNSYVKTLPTEENPATYIIQSASCFRYIKPLSENNDDNIATLSDGSNELMSTVYTSEPPTPVELSAIPTEFDLSTGSYTLSSVGASSYNNLEEKVLRIYQSNKNQFTTNWFELGDGYEGFTIYIDGVKTQGGNGRPSIKIGQNCKDIHIVLQNGTTLSGGWNNNVISAGNNSNVTVEGSGMLGVDHDKPIVTSNVIVKNAIAYSISGKRAYTICRPTTYEEEYTLQIELNNPTRYVAVVPDNKEGYTIDLRGSNELIRSISDGEALFTPTEYNSSIPLINVEKVPIVTAEITQTPESGLKRGSYVDFTVLPPTTINGSGWQIEDYDHANSVWNWSGGGMRFDGTKTTNNHAQATQSGTKTVTASLQNSKLKKGDFEKTVPIAANKSVVVEDAATEVPFDVKIAPPGDNEWGTTLTATINCASFPEGIDENGFKFTWYRSKMPSGHSDKTLTGGNSESTYKTVKEDSTYYVFVEATPRDSTLYTGTAVSNAIEIKRQNIKPDAPTVVKVTDETITINTIPGYSYICNSASKAISTPSIDDSNWDMATDTTLTFNGLRQSSQYKIYAKCPKDSYYESLVSEASIASTKGHPDIPEKITVTKVTSDMVKIKAEPGQEYAIMTNMEDLAQNDYKGADSDDKNTVTFSGLTPESTYWFVTRLAETETKAVGTDYDVTSVTTLMVSPGDPLEINYINETASLKEGLLDSDYDISFNSDFSDDFINSGGSITKIIPASSSSEPSKIYVRKKSSKGNFTLYSETVEYNVKPRQEAPDVVIDYTNETLSTGKTMEYSIDGGNSWNGCTDTMNAAEFGWDGSNDTGVKVRFAATIGAFKSGEQKITIEKRQVKPKVEIDYAAEKLSTENTMEYSTDEGNSWNKCTNRMNATNFGWDGKSDKEVKFRTAATADKFKSEEQSLTIPKRQDIPRVEIDYTNETLSTEETMEYITESANTWDKCTSQMNAAAFDWDGTSNMDIKIRFAVAASAFKSEEQEITIAKRPNKPKVEIDYKNETLSTEGTMEYSVDGGNSWSKCTNQMNAAEFGWDGSNDTGVKVRFAATIGAFKSGEQKITIEKRQVKPKVEIDYAAEKLSTENTMEYSTDEGNSWSKCANTMNATEFDWDGTSNMDIKIRLSATASAFKSEEQEITIAKRPIKPRVEIDYTNETLSTEETMEYSIDGGNSWNGCTDTMNAKEFSWDGRDDKEVKIRTAATADKFKSEEQSLTIPKRQDIPRVEIDYTNETLSTGETMEYSIDGGNSWNECTGQMNATEFSWDGRDDKEVKIRTAATVDKFKSEEQSLTIPKRQDIPRVEIDYTNETLSTRGTMEYSIDGGSSWSKCTDIMNAIEFGWNGETDKLVKFRMAATIDKFKSEEQDIIIPVYWKEPDILGKMYKNLSTENFAQTSDRQIYMVLFSLAGLLTISGILVTIARKKSRSKR